MRRGASRADDQLAAIPVRPRFCGCGTTATVVALHGASASVMHVGDSRAVLGLSCGKVRRMSEDHRPGRADELRRIEREGGLVLEVMHRLEADTDADAPDKLWGLSWRVTELDSAHLRLTEAGLTVSEIRTGRKPGTRVFTVKSGTLGVPTLFIGPSKD